MAAVAAAMALAAGMLTLPAPSGADVASVTGSAYGYYANIALFGSQQPPAGPAPTVTLPAAGSAVPVTGAEPSAAVKYGPATFFTSGPLLAGTQGTTGPAGSVTSSASIANVNASGQEVLTASSVASTCTASESGVKGSTAIVNGTLQTDSGDSDPTNTIPDHGPTTVPVPANPAPNTVVEGHIHVNGATDTFRYVFNEQVTNPDGSLTVNAAHQYLLGPTATGDVVIGQSVCGATGTTPATGATAANNMTAAAITPPPGAGAEPKLSAAALPEA
ncbi:MAG: hypothetical protein M3349_03405, partial [Actinomycetota bacterium]|nr:hypothetical protein [Actinomycetota bacterium]